MSGDLLVSTCPLTPAAPGAQGTRGLLAGASAACGVTAGWAHPECPPHHPEHVPVPPAPCLLLSEHLPRRDETKPHRGHCLSDYEVLLIEGATNVCELLC